MSYSTVLNILGLVVFAIYMLTWLTVYRLAKLDRNYFKTQDGLARPWDPTSAFQVMKMVLDPRLPNKAHGSGIRKYIYLIRVGFVVGLACTGAFFYIFLKYVAIA